ncbi:MAG: type II secretion system protein GspG [Pseudomonadota bacterium]
MLFSHDPAHWMRRLTIIVLTFYISACSDPVENAQQAMLEGLGGYSELEFGDITAFSGGAVCGEYRSADRFGRGGRFAPFIVWGDITLARPSSADVAFFCTEESEAVLRNDHGIGPIADQQAQLQHIRRDLRALESAIEQYRAQNFRLVPVEQGLAALLEVSSIPEQSEDAAVSAYLEELPLDPWGKPYGYTPIGLGGGVAQQFDVFTLGADGTEGGVGENADIRLKHLRYLDYLLGN